MAGLICFHGSSSSSLGFFVSLFGFLFCFGFFVFVLPEDYIGILPLMCLLFIDLKSYAKMKQNKTLPVAAHQA